MDESEGGTIGDRFDRDIQAKKRFRSLKSPSLSTNHFLERRSPGLTGAWLDYSIQTSIPPSYKDIYHFNELEIGLSYLPRGASIILGGYVKWQDEGSKQ